MMLLAQAMEGPTTWWELVSTGGAVAALLLFLYGFKAEWWVTGTLYQRRVKEVQEAQEALNTYRDKMEERFLPLLVEGNQVLGQLAERRQVIYRDRDNDERSRHG